MIKFREKLREKGFSLVELMIVVAIIAILAAIAIPSFLRFAMKSKTSEATGNLAAIRVCEDSYKAENDVYLSCLPTPDPFVSDSTPDAWAGGGITQFATIGFAPDGNVRYQYDVTASSTTPDWVATAACDLDENGTDRVYTLDTSDTSNYPKPVVTDPAEY